MAIVRPPFTGNIFDAVAFDRWMRAWKIEADPGTVGTEEISGGAAASDGGFYVKRAGELTFDGIEDSDLPPSIARGTEVAQAITDHEAESNPHPVYTSDAEAAVIAAAAVTAHEGEADPHPAYLLTAEGNAAYQPLAAVLSMLHTGTGSPETVLAAPVGHIYLRTDGGASTVLYVKEGGGGGNTGWAAK